MALLPLVWKGSEQRHLSALSWWACFWPSVALAVFRPVLMGLLVFQDQASAFFLRASAVSECGAVRSQP